MQIIKKKSPNAGYVEGDSVAIVSDAHVFSVDEHNSDIFTIEIGITLTDAEISKIQMNDEQINRNAASNLPTFRSLSTNISNLKYLHRRKYQYTSGNVLLKPDAQESI